jgi:hypothetical protein
MADTTLQPGCAPANPDVRLDESNLAPHIATADEPIPALTHPDRWAGPDMQCVLPIDQMLEWLHQLDDDVVSYVKLWRRMLAVVGNNVSLNYDHQGERRLSVGGPIDAQVRHRSRWQHFLVQNLYEDPERIEHLKDVLHDEGNYSDNRPADPRGTTAAIRGFLRTEGRILITPDGKLTEGGGLPRMFADGTDAQADEVLKAARIYFDARRRWRSEAHIKRAVRMLGSRTDNGWIVLQAKASAERVAA